MRGRRARAQHSLAVVVDHLGSPLQHPVPHKVVGAAALEVAQVHLHLSHPVQGVQGLRVDASQFVPNEPEFDKVGQPLKSPRQRCQSVVAELQLVEVVTPFDISRTERAD